MWGAKCNREQPYYFTDSPSYTTELKKTSLFTPFPIPYSLLHPPLFNSLNCIIKELCKKAYIKDQNES